MSEFAKLVVFLAFLGLSQSFTFLKDNAETKYSLYAWSHEYTEVPTTTTLSNFSFTANILLERQGNIIQGQIKDINILTALRAKGHKTKPMVLEHQGSDLKKPFEILLEENGAFREMRIAARDQFTIAFLKSLVAEFLKAGNLIKRIEANSGFVKLSETVEEETNFGKCNITYTDTKNQKYVVIKANFMPKGCSAPNQRLLWGDYDTQDSWFTLDSAKRKLLQVERRVNQFLSIVTFDKAIILEYIEEKDMPKYVLNHEYDTLSSDKPTEF